ncbi:Di-sulfide bridge nucleocytoplasmic transport domain-containing protein [Abortiporus biennis]|nr:Di-sulfide bridge nucleocytoplasmic transport domain-containing protein [Abortiporus biennis]
MDFEFTSRPTRNFKPVWAESQGNVNEMNPPASPFPSTPHTPQFGRNPNVPFIFNSPVPQTPHTPAWQPPPHFSPQKAFPQPEVHDVDMSEPSPGKPASPEKEVEAEKNGANGERAVALGGMRRVYRSRQIARERSRLGRARSRVDDEDATDIDSEEEDQYGPVTQNTSNHYTLNLPGPAPQQSDLPYILLGYLQFFFNLSLILVFLYLLVQFILTVQRDVEQRISEYSMDIVQEIAQCALHFKNNLCATNPIPAMAHQCGLWETCMNRDPTKVGRAKVGAELIAEVVNGFVEPISWKTLAFTIISLAFFTMFINSLLSLYRSRLHATPLQPPLAHQASIPAILPIHPHPQTYPPHMLKSWTSGMAEVEEMPSRRRKLEGGAVKDIK